MTQDFTPAAISGADVVAAARTYLGVRFKHAGVTRDGICCSGLALAVGKELEQVPLDVQLPAHNPLRPNPRLFAQIALYAVPIERGGERPGDVVVMSHSGSVPQHVAFLSDVGVIQIFPALSIFRVAEHSLDDEWRRRFLAFYRYKGVMEVVT